VHGATVPNGARVFIADKDDDTVTTYVPLLSGSLPATISLPTGSMPVFVHTREAAHVYVANSGTASVGVIDVNTNQLGATVGVGNNPVSLAELPPGNKLYCVNQADNTVTVISTVDRLVLATIPVGNSPVFAVTNDTGAFVFVANQSD